VFISIANRRKPLLTRSGMARVKGITRLSTNGMILPAFYSVSTHQMAPPERGSAHPITVNYSFIDLERMKG